MAGAPEATRERARISPTAHYTGYVWCRNGLADPALATWQGRLLFHGLEGGLRVAALTTGGLTLERMLLRRHLVIDHILGGAIADGRVGQVVELAAGLSPRGYRLARERAVAVVEADLPAMAARKRRMLRRGGLLVPGLRVLAVDAFAEDGPLSIEAAIAPWLDRSRGLAVVTEGLVNYFPRPAVERLWARVGLLLADHPRGLYLSDHHLASESLDRPAGRAVRRLLSAFTRGPTFLDWRRAGDARASLAAAGFREVRAHRPADFGRRVALPAIRGPDVLRVVEAWR